MSARVTPELTSVRDGERLEPATRPLDFRLIARIMGYTRPYAGQRNALLVLVVIRSIQISCLAWLLGAVIADITRHQDPWRLAIGTGIFFALAAATALTFHFRSRYALELGEAVVHDLRNDIFTHIQRMPMRFFDTTKLGRIISRMTSDAEAVRAGVQDVLFVSMVSGGQMLVAAAFMLWIDWRLFLMVMGISPVMWCMNRVFHMRFSTAMRDMQESFSRVTATMAESVNGIRVTQGYAREDVNAALFHNLVSDHSQYNFQVARLRGLFLPLLNLNNQLFLAGLLLIGGYLVFHADMPLVDIVQFFFLAGVFFAPIQNLGNQYAQALTAMAGSERVFNLLDTEPEWEDPPDAIDMTDMEGRVEFRDVSFAYDPGKPVLQHISFSAEPGQLIAMVGQTGSGKSTIIKLISKFHLPVVGELLIDGVDIRRISSESLHRNMGIVLQSNFLFTGTVMDNIRFGKPGASDEEVVEAARKLDCLDLIESLSEGFHTQVGEGGGSLSLGQRQLVCFTRAMLADPRILILDEATSAVDTMTELRIQRALDVLLAGRTSFVVAHRLSTIRNADTVLVLDHGEVVERGEHRELLAADGVYADLYRQFISAEDE